MADSLKRQTIQPETQISLELLSFKNLTHTARVWKAWISLKESLTLTLDWIEAPTHWLIVDLIPFLQPFATCIDGAIIRLLIRHS